MTSTTTDDIKNDTPTPPVSAVDSDDSGDLGPQRATTHDNHPSEQHLSKLEPNAGINDAYDLSDEDNDSPSPTTSKNDIEEPKNMNDNCTSEKSDDEEESSMNKPKPSFLQQCIDFYWTYEFLILVVLAISFAKIYPPLGAIYVYPQYTAKWMAVIFIFLMSGLSLKTEELGNAFKQLKFNAAVQIHNFCWCSVCGYGLGNFLKATNIVSDDLATGMIICSCLPITVSMAIALTAACDGDIAAAVFNTAFSNMAGVFVSPGLIFLYVGKAANVNVGNVFLTLTYKIIIPVIAGQIIRNLFKPIAMFFNNRKYFFKQCQTYALVFILLTVFSTNFEKGKPSSLGDVFKMIAFQFVLMMWLMTTAWFLFKYLFPTRPKLRAMGLYGGTHKSIANGVPLIASIYGHNPALATFTLPILVWHPMLLVVGTFVTPKLTQFIRDEQKRLNLDEDDNPRTVQNDNDDVVIVFDQTKTKVSSAVDNQEQQHSDDGNIDNDGNLKDRLSHPTKYTKIPNNPFDDPLG